MNKTFTPYCFYKKLQKDRPLEQMQSAKAHLSLTEIIFQEWFDPKLRYLGVVGVVARVWEVQFHAISVKLTS